MRSDNNWTLQDEIDFIRGRRVAGNHGRGDWHPFTGGKIGRLAALKVYRQNLFKREGLSNEFLYEITKVIDEEIDKMERSGSDINNALSA